MVQFNNGLSDNIRASDAPVSFPFLWGTHQSNVVQWTGFAPNGPASLGTLIRNGGEVLGVYGQVDILENQHAYDSSLAIKNLGFLEKWVADLRSPAWPTKYLPSVDLKLAAQGQLHYDKYCSSCHQVIARENQGKPYQAVLTPIKDVQTDPTEWNNMISLRLAGEYQGRKELVFFGDKIPEQTSGLNPLVNSVTGALLRHPFETIEAALIENSQDKKANDEMMVNQASDLPPQLRESLNQHQQLLQSSVKSQSDQGGTYKARPLTGIWATAPYLHNGSVPNLYELLLSAEQRSKIFYLGSREFDAKKVGFVSTLNTTDESRFKFDTSLKGNSNQGHEYGTKELNDKQRLELLEYLKTL